MIFALYGGSGCGKTTLAKIAGRELAIPVRHCGEEFRDALDTANIEMSTAESLHQRVDQQTRAWCAQTECDAVVDGRFLDQVLSGLPNVLLIEIRATDEVRARRLTERLDRPINDAEVRALDEEDDLFRARMYPGVSRAQKAQVIETGGGSALECGEKLISLISQLRAAARG